jgi:exodeoxyribonuclease VII small subunit
LDNNKSFEDKMKRVDEISALISNGSAGLRESVALFEEGMKLIDELQLELDGTKAKVQMLIGASDPPVTEDFEC